jgi:hypothetical protein
MASEDGRLKRFPDPAQALWAISDFLCQDAEYAQNHYGRVLPIIRKCIELSSYLCLIDQVHSPRLCAVIMWAAVDPAEADARAASGVQIGPECFRADGERIYVVAISATDRPSLMRVVLGAKRSMPPGKDVRWKAGQQRKQTPVRFYATSGRFIARPAPAELKVL